MTHTLEQLRAYPSHHAAQHHELREVLVRAVRASGLSHGEIATRAGVHRSTISYLVSGKRIGTLDVWNDVLEACGVQLGFRLVEQRESA